MSGGWVPCNADWWEQVAAALTATGQPWPEAAVLMDLRWWDDRERMSGGRKPRPGRAVLQARWNLTERPTRRLMADVEAWRDPAQADLRPELSVPRAPQQRPSAAPAMPSERPATVPAAAPEHRPAQQGCPADAQAKPRACPGDAQGVPAKRPQRENTPSPSQTPSPPPPPQSAPPPAAAKGGAEQVPGWLSRWATDCPVVERVQPAALGRALLAATAAVTGRAVEAAWGGQPAAPWAGPGEGELRLRSAEATLTPAYKLWDSTGRPPLDAWGADVELVARAARECPIPVFAREIRGEGEARAGHQRSLKTVLNPLRFADRLQAARRWAEVARPAAPALRLVDPAEAEAHAADVAAVSHLEAAVGPAALAEAYLALAEAGVPADQWAPRLARLGRAESPRVALAAALAALADQAQGAARAAGGGR